MTSKVYDQSEGEEHRGQRRRSWGGEVLESWGHRLCLWNGGVGLAEVRSESLGEVDIGAHLEQRPWGRHDSVQVCPGSSEVASEGCRDQSQEFGCHAETSQCQACNWEMTRSGLYHNPLCSSRLLGSKGGSRAWEEAYCTEGWCGPIPGCWKYGGKEKSVTSWVCFEGGLRGTVDWRQSENKRGSSRIPEPWVWVTRWMDLPATETGKVSKGLKQRTGITQNIFWKNLFVDGFEPFWLITSPQVVLVKWVASARGWGSVSTYLRGRVSVETISGQILAHA